VFTGLRAGEILGLRWGDLNFDLGVVRVLRRVDRTGEVVRKYGLHPAVKRAWIDTPGKPRLRFHDLTHTFASLLIAQGVNVAFASRQLGHASVSTTLNVYTHLFDHVEHAATVMERPQARFGETLRPVEPEPSAGQEAVAIGRLGQLA
jgi:integrase